MEFLNAQSLQVVLLVFQVIVAVTLIGLILIQHGKGADAGAAFGSGASSTVFGSQGSGNFLTRTTAVFAFLFLGNSLLLGYIATGRVGVPPSLMEGQPLVVEEAPSVITEEVVPTAGTPPSLIEVEPLVVEEVPSVITEEVVPVESPAVDTIEFDIPSIPVEQSE